ncbi:hypothetical protein Hypma_004456 [Hypsizygus marmoreus]|uniref:Uncharacterized protein n=1 Tax=Hypsizygus marmoreus TaxID=39966 RepID=A0A369K371_HYPMA|nr:hypothetical protein Hypma_004456 [Hypsizygus marmoreus]
MPTRLTPPELKRLRLDISRGPSQKVDDLWIPYLGLLLQITRKPRFSCDGLHHIVAVSLDTSDYSLAEPGVPHLFNKITEAALEEILVAIPFFSNWT